MEIACNILPRYNFELSLKKYKSIKYKKEFENLKLNTIYQNNMDQFLKLLNTPEYIETTLSFFTQYFCDMDHNISKIVLMAFYIHRYSNILFDKYKTKLEQKLIISANKVVQNINKLLKNYDIDLVSTLLTNIDNYYSLYKIWSEKDSIDKMAILFENIQNNINILKIQKKNKCNCDINHKCLIKYIDDLFDLNQKYALRIILHDYHIFYNMPKFEKEFWDKIRTIYINHKDIYLMFVILVVELKIKLIQILSNPIDRKDIYYKLDTENIINRISTNTLDDNYIINIMDLLQNKITTIDYFYIKQNIKKKKLYRTIINIFEKMYNSILYARKGEYK
jgi:hypothetical protein